MSISIPADKKKAYDERAIENFREYLRIPSVHPDIDYNDCVKFLLKQANQIGLQSNVYFPKPGKPVVVLTWVGTEKDEPSILLNSHMDVVPVFEEKWTHKPFSADMDDTGKIFARGAQDMKCVSIQYLETIRRLKENGVKLRRTLHCSFVPEEEVGGILGMKEFILTNDFKNLNIGFSMDEGLACPTEEFMVYYGERCIWHLVFHCPGQTGHGSLLLENTAGEKVNYLLNKIFENRETEKKKLKDNPSLSIGDVTTLNVTILEGGVQNNVVPPEFRITMDCRIPVTVSNDKWFATLEQWCKDAGEGVWMEKQQFDSYIAPTKLDSSNIYWVAFKAASDKLGMKLKQQIFPGGTDSRFVRNIGIPAIGFSPMNNTPVLLHDDNEYLEASVFLKGIELYCSLIPAVANAEDKSGYNMYTT